jgi:hypothetical protein
MPMHWIFYRKTDLGFRCYRRNRYWRPIQRTRALNRKMGFRGRKIEKRSPFHCIMMWLSLWKERQRISSMPKSVQEYRKCGFGHSRKRRCFNWNNYEFTGTVPWTCWCCCLGAYLHGLAADIALPETGHQSFIIAGHNQIFGKAFWVLQNKSPEKGLKVYIFNSLNKSISSVSDGLGALNLQCCHLGRLE